MTSATLAPSWDELRNRIRPFVRRRVSADADADDILQEILLKMHRGLPDLRDETRLFPWMYRIAKTAIVDHARLRSRQGRDPVADVESSAPQADDDDRVARLLAQELAYFIEALPSPYREAVTMTDLEGRSQKEAADALGISLSGMKSRVQRGRSKLREMIERCCEVAIDARGKVIACEPRSGRPQNCCG